MIFNEDSRVKIPALLHLMQLGYEYLSLKSAKWNPDSNVFTDIFREKLFEINEGVKILNNLDGTVAGSKYN